ncbi:hypothetical protein B0H67DRAFT_598797 [Lasiosphaeris hirsuta]|uniref:EKC/KEOPS complex subunit BUD32 n=1 Tax=Lasiosphaeris hirsuta TaxID=260670 RepID=A0AA40B0X5_9PEZI|nr:hypothetical protein B0H67DRAFT_598797 [Lasiosphaeris hirsuta]
MLTRVPPGTCQDQVARATQILQDLTLDLLSDLRNLPAIRFLPSKTGHGTLRNDLLRLNSAASSFDVDRIKPLLKSAISDNNDALIWNEFYKAQTPWLHNTGSFANSDELGTVYVGLPRFYETFFRRVAGLETASEAVFEKCKQSSEPLFSITFAEEYKPTPTQRRPLVQPNKPIQGSTAERKLDVSFIDSPKARKDLRYHYNLTTDISSKALFNIGMYAREVLADVDRLGGLVSKRLDINKDGYWFMFTVLGFLWINKEDLGFDLTITTENRTRFIEINRNNSTKHLIIDGLIQRTPYRESLPQMPLCHEEGEFLREMTSKGVINMARHYHHETVQIYRADDDVRNNVRGGQDITLTSEVSRRGCRSSAVTGKKRLSSQTGASLPHSKRPCSTSPVKAGGDLSNRVHRRVILRDYGKPIYKASSRTSLLALSGCIEGHESLHKASVLHRDISINNLLINEDTNNLSTPSFLIDLDLAIKEDREGTSGAKGKTGTRAFMAIRVLLGEQHSFMHDLESFFWVLFRICIHFNGPGKAIGPTVFDSWNYEHDRELAGFKKSVIDEEVDFLTMAENSFTPYYRPLIPWVNRLRREVSPNGKRWKTLEPRLYSLMKKMLCKAGEDPNVVADSQIVS